MKTRLIIAAALSTLLAAGSCNPGTVSYDMTDAPKRERDDRPREAAPKDHYEESLRRLRTPEHHYREARKILDRESEQ